MDENQQSIDPEFRDEYQKIKSDIKRVAITNILFLLLLIGVYFANQKFDFLSQLERFF